MPVKPTLLETARAYVKAGNSIFPVLPAGHEKAKAPALWNFKDDNGKVYLHEVTGEAHSWQPFQKRRPSDAELSRWYSDNRFAVGIVCGAISNNLECLDFDRPDMWELYEAELATLAPELYEKVKRCFLSKSPKKGHHLWYRCAEPIGKGEKLATIPAVKSEDGKTTLKPEQTLIETRGEGHYCVDVPSPGYVSLRSDLLNLPVLTTEERSLLRNIARTFDQRPLTSIYQAPAEQPRPSRSEGEGKRPGDDYNERGAGDALALLQKHGWQILHQRGEVYHLRKPNSTSPTLHATFGHKGAFLYVFSSSASPFDNEKGYSPFAIYALLECTGDFTEAARRLAQDGYGERLETAKVGLYRHNEALQKILDGDFDDAPEEEASNLDQVENSNLKNASFCEKKGDKREMEFKVWLRRGRALKRWKKEADKEYMWAVGQWYNAEVSNIPHGSKSSWAEGIFGENGVATVRTYASAVRGWERDELKPEPSMTAKIIRSLAPVSKEKKIEACEQWARGERCDSETLKKRLRDAGEMTQSYERVGREHLGNVIGKEAYEMLGRAVMDKEERGNIAALSRIIKLITTVRDLRELNYHVAKEEEQEETADTLAEPQEHPSNTQVAKDVDYIWNSSEPTPVETPETVATALPMESRDAQETVQVYTGTFDDKPPEKTSPAPMSPKFPNVFAVARERPASLEPPPIQEEDLPALDDGQFALFDIPPLAHTVPGHKTIGTEFYSH